VDWEPWASDKDSTRLVLIQRSCGYSWRPSLNCRYRKNCPHRQTAQPNTICFVDNCYGEFIENREPTAVGADLIAGSLIKNPGGTIVTAGGYVAGREDLVEAAACRLTAPGIGSSGGATFDKIGCCFKGCFSRPKWWGSDEEQPPHSLCV